MRAWRETYGLPVVLSNCSNNYGPFHFPEKLIPVVILNALHGRDDPGLRQGRERPRLALRRGPRRRRCSPSPSAGGLGESYNIGGNAEARNIEIVRAHLRADGRDGARRAAPHERLIAFVTDRPGHDFRYAIDASKIRDELGWQPSVTLDEGLRRTVRWYLDNRDWWQAIQARGHTLERLGLKARA